MTRDSRGTEVPRRGGSFGSWKVAREMEIGQVIISGL